MTAITGIAGLPDGSVFANGAFTFTRLPRAVVAQSGMVVTPTTISVTANGSGAVDFDILAGNYQGTESTTGVSFAFNVPNVASADFADCVDAATVSLLPEMVQSAIDAADRAEAAAGSVPPPFASRVEAVAWATGVDGVAAPDGTVIWADGLGFFKYTGATEISDMPDWFYMLEPYPDHFGYNADPGVTDMGAAIAARQLNIYDPAYKTNQTILHPDVRSPVDIGVIGSVTPLYRIRYDNIRLTGQMQNTNATGFGVTVDKGISGFFIQNMDIQSAGFSVLIKPSTGLGGTASNGIATGNNIRGSAATADLGISADGDTRNFLAHGNIITDLQRSDGAGRYAHALTSAGNDGDIPVADNENILFALNVVDDINGNGAHFEDDTPRQGTAFNLINDVRNGIEITTGDGVIAQMHYHIGNMVSGFDVCAFYCAGTVSSKLMAVAFNIWDGTGKTQTTAGVRINQLATRDIFYLGNIHYNFANDGIESTAEGRVHIDYNAFESITGNALVGKASASSRGLLIGSHNTFQTVGGIIDTANAANVMGDQNITTGTLLANVAAEQIVMVAPRSGYVTAVTRFYPGAAQSTSAGYNQAVFTLLKRASGGTETTILTNSIERAPAQYNTTRWGCESNQIVNHTFAAGDMIIFRSDGSGGLSARTIQLQIEWFYYN